MKVDIDDIIFYLSDTENSLVDAMMNLYETKDISLISQQDMAKLNETIFQCNSCKVWHVVSNQSEENIGNCIDCDESDMLEESE